MRLVGLGVVVAGPLAGDFIRATYHQARLLWPFRCHSDTPTKFRKHARPGRSFSRALKCVVLPRTDRPPFTKFTPTPRAPERTSTKNNARDRSIAISSQPLRNGNHRICSHGRVRCHRVLFVCWPVFTQDSGFQRACS
jgi:hypothetical protein